MREVGRCTYANVDLVFLVRVHGGQDWVYWAGLSGLDCAQLPKNLSGRVVYQFPLEGFEGLTCFV